MKNKEILYLSLILLLALSLRLCGIQWGLPNNDHRWGYQVDEAYPLFSLSQINPREGTYFIHNFGWGQCYTYELGAVLKALSLLGVIVVKNSIDFYSQHINELAKIYLCGRLLTVFWSMISIMLIWWLGKRFFSKNTGLLAALFLSVLPFPVIFSHYMTTHIQFMALCILAIIFAGYINEQENVKKWYFLFGAAAGLAFGSYLFPALTLFIFFFFINKRLSLQNMFLVAGTFILFFLLTNPGIIFYWKDFMGTWVSYTSHEMGPAIIFAPENVGRFLVRYLHYGTGAIFFGIFLVSIIHAILKGGRFKTAILYWGVFYYIFCSLPIFGNFMRHFSALFPAMALFVALMIDGIKNRSIRRLIFVIAFLPPLLFSLSVLKIMTGEDSRSAAYRWINENIKPRSTIYVPRWFFVPHISTKQYNIIEKKEDGEKASYWLFSSFDMVRFGRPSGAYRLKRAFIQKPEIFGITFDDHNSSEDMRYTHPEIFVYEKNDKDF